MPLGSDSDAPGTTGRASLDDASLLRLLDVGRSLLAELDLDEVLHRVLDVARELTGARYAALGVLDESHTRLAQFLTSGIDEEAARRIGDKPRGHGVLGELIRSPAPLRLDNVADHVRSYGFPPNHPPMSTFLGVPILVRGAPWGNLYLTEKDGGPFTEGDEHALLVLADWASIAIYNAHLYTSQGERRDELERTVAALEATMSIARALGAETDLGRVLELVTKRGRALLEARIMVIALLDGDALVVRSVSGAAGEGLLGRRLALDTPPGDEATSAVAPLAGQAMHLRQALAREVGASSVLLVPLRYREDTVGVLAAFDRMDGEGGFAAAEERLLEAFAASAATAVVTAQRVAASTLIRRVEAAEHERARWARELHDENLQDLAGLKILLASGRRGAPDDRLSGVVDEAIARLSLSIDSLRRLIADLRPAALDQLGVTAALEDLAERTRSSGGFAVDLHVEIDESRLAPESASTIYRLVQEGLTNVTKHACASRAIVRVLMAAGGVDVEVRDDGKGFDPASPAAGFGIVGMRERVELASGTLDVQAAPGAGTLVRAHIPLDRREGGPAPLTAG